MKSLVLALGLLTGILANAQEAALSVVSPPAQGTVSSAAQSEQEIPVVLEAPKKAVDSGQSLFKYTLAFGILGVLACASYFFLKKYRFKNPVVAKTQIKILTQHYLGPKKSLAIIRVAGESMLVGITDSNINLIKSLALLDEEIPEETTEKIPSKFASVFSSKMQTQTIQEDSQDEFAISGIRDIVSGKLKNMRNL